MLYLEPHPDRGDCCWAATITAAIIAAGGLATQAVVTAKGNQNAADTNAAAAGKSAQLQTTAAGHAADLQAKAAADALAFQRQQAAYAAQTADATARANYEQWAARQHQLGSIGQQLGLPARQVPDYSPLPPAPFGGQGGQQATAGAPQGGGTPGGNPSQMFLASMQKHGLDPVAMQGKGAQIAAAVNADYPGLGVTVNPKTDAIVWPGIGPVDVTIDSGKGGWAFMPNSANRTASMAPQQVTSQGPMGTPYGGTVADYLQALPQANTLQIPKLQPIYGGSVAQYL